MFITVTIKAEAESRGELIDTFASQFETLRQHCDSLHKEGVFGPPEQCALRYLVIGGGFREPREEEHREPISPDVE